MKQYFKRLWHHPGLPVAVLVTIVLCFGAFSKYNAGREARAFFVAVIVSTVFLWLPVLITNIKKDKV